MPQIRDLFRRPEGIDHIAQYAINPEEVEVAIGTEFNERFS